MNSAKLVEVKKIDPETMSGFIKLYAHGKLGLLFDGPEEYQAVAEECFKRALDIRITVDDIQFVRSMRDSGTPETAINEFLNSCSIFDEVHLGRLNQ
jgi:hypothetical protein